MDEYDATPHSATEKFILPTAPRAARGPDASDERIPRDPVNNTDTIRNKSAVWILIGLLYLISPEI